MPGIRASAVPCAALAFLLAGCSAASTPRADADQAVAFATRLNARTAQIATANGRYAAVSTLIDMGRPPRLVLRTRLNGNARDEIGLAAATFYATARKLAREMDLACEINGDFAPAAMVWNGREVSCDLVTVRF